MRADLVLALYRKSLEFPVWTEERAEWYHQALVYFVENFIRPVLPIPDFHKRGGDGWYWLLARYGYYLNLTSREHGKTAVHSIFNPLCRICCDRSVRIALLSNTMDQAKMFLTGLKGHLEQNELIIRGFGTRDAFSEEYTGFPLPLGRGWLTDGITVQRRVAAADDPTRIRIEKDQTVVALGMGSPTIGRRTDMNVYDDCIDDDNSATEFQCRKAKMWFQDSLSMIVRDGQCVVVGTPKSYRDLYQELLRNEAFKNFQSPATRDLDDEAEPVLWADKWPRKELKKRRAAQGTLQFNRNYLLQVMSDADSHFPMAWLNLCYDPKLILPVENHDAKMIKVTGVDPAIAEGQTASYFSTVTLGLERDGRLVLLDVFRQRGMSPATQRRKLADLWARYDSEMVVEKNGVQKYFTDDLPADIPVKLFWTGAKKIDFEVGIPSLSLMVEQGRLRIPRGNQRSETLTDLLINEAHYWPRYESSDVLMAFWFAASRLRTLAKRYNISFVLPSADSGLMGKRDVDLEFAPRSSNERLPGIQIAAMRPALGGMPTLAQRRKKAMAKW